MIKNDNRADSDLERVVREPSPPEIVVVPTWPKPRGYANGVVAEGRLLSIAGQIGWDTAGRLVSTELLAQFAQALDNVLAVLAAAGGAPEHVVSMNVFVTDMPAYRACLRGLGPVWTARFGRHYPTMALMGVSELVEPDAKVEIVALAVLPGRTAGLRQLREGPERGSLAAAMVAASLPTPRTFELTLNDGVAAFVLDRPARLNSLTFAIYEELAQTFESLSAVEDVRSITITGRGRGFCSGGDQDDIIAELFARDMAGLLAFTRATGRLIAAIRNVRRPVIAAIHGACVGAGAVIATACDLRVADRTAKFGFVFPKVGLSGADMGASYLLPRIVGHGRASEILYFGDIFDAETAERWGFVNKLVEPGEDIATAGAWAKRLAEGPAFAHAMTKVMLEKEHTMSLAEAIEAEAQAQAICMQHPDFKTAHFAWKEKREPLFSGSPKKVTP